MKQIEIERLKLAANQFYMAVDLDKPQMSDFEFDALRKEYESEGASVKDLVDWQFDKSLPNEPMEELSKIQVQDNDLWSSINQYLVETRTKFHYLNYKYDGSSIKAYYKDGKLQKILGTPDCEFGFIRTKAFWSLFPHEVDPQIASIQGEVLVDAKVYGQLARNAANGLTNSKYKDAEVAREAFIRVYGVKFVDGQWDYHRQLAALWTLPKIEVERHRLSADQSAEVSTFEKHLDVVFAPAQTLKMDQIPTEPIVSTEPNVDFQVDGVVLYSESEVKGFKFYYTEYADVEVLNVNWNHKLNGSYAPVLQIENCYLNEKSINKVSAGGVPNLMKLQMGKGAKVRVILANMTIPKVIKVIIPSDDYQWPKCDCGYQMGPDDIYGSTLKCQKEDDYCISKTSEWYRDLVNQISYDEGKTETFDAYFKIYWDWFLGYLFIDRWNPSDKLHESITVGQVIDRLLESIHHNDRDDFYRTITDWFYLTDLNASNLNINVYSTFQAIYQLMSDWDKLSEEYAQSLFE